MPKVGDAYVEIKPDLSAFGAGLTRQIEEALRPAVDQHITQHVDVDVDRSQVEEALSPLQQIAREASAKAAAELADIGKVTPSTRAEVDIAQADVKLDELRTKIVRLSAMHPTVKVDADIAKAVAELEIVQRKRDKLANDHVNVGGLLGGIGGITNDITAALGSLSSAVGGFLGVGGAFRSLGAASAAAAPLVAALAVAVGVLAASFGAAVAGAGALGVALAGALGPVAAIGFFALARVVAVLKAMHDDGQHAASSANAVAAAQDQLASATQGVANAQTNLQQQTQAAYRAWQDSIEAVKDDLLGVQDAQLGIEDAQLSLREAEQAVKDFKAQAPGLDNVFKKFTDVNVDLSGLHGALDAARKASGGRLSGDDELKLERLILNVRRAKLQEKHATDDLHDANVKLQRDRQTEADFARRGLAAYPGYTSAVQGLASAQRQLAAAHRAAGAAAAAQQGELAKLSPIEQRLAGTFALIGKGLKAAFAPAMVGVLGGLNRGLRIFAGVLTDRRISRSLREIGTAIGGAFVTLARFLAGAQMRDAFVQLARGGAQLVKVLGGRVFRDLLVIFTQLAVAALPAMLQLFRDLAGVLDRWARWIAEHPAKFRAAITDLTNTFRGWLGVILDIGGFLLKLGGTLKSIGDTVGRVFRNLGSALGLNARDVRDLGKAWDNLKTVFGAVVKAIVPSLRVALQGVGAVVRGVIRVVAGLISGDWAEAWKPFADAGKSALDALAGIFRHGIGRLAKLGSALAQAFVRDFRTVINTITGIARKVVSGIVSIINTAIDAINAVIGKIPNIDIPGLGHTRPGKIGKVTDPFGPHTTGATAPRSPNQGQGAHGIRATAAVRLPTLIAANGDSARTVIEHQEVQISAPAAAVPDPQSAALKFARYVDSLG